MREGPSGPTIHHFFYNIFFAFNRLRHRDKLPTVRLGWLGSAAYSRLLVKRTITIGRHYTILIIKFFKK